VRRQMAGVRVSQRRLAEGGLWARVAKVGCGLCCLAYLVVELDVCVQAYAGSPHVMSHPQPTTAVCLSNPTLHNPPQLHPTLHQAIGRRALEADATRTAFAALSTLATRLCGTSAARALDLAGPFCGLGASEGDLGVSAEKDDAAAAAHAAGWERCQRRFNAQTAGACCVPGEGEGQRGGGGGAIDSLVLPLEVAGLFKSL